VDRHEKETETENTERQKSRKKAKTVPQYVLKVYLHPTCLYICLQVECVYKWIKQLYTGLKCQLDLEAWYLLGRSEINLGGLHGAHQGNWAHPTKVIEATAGAASHKISYGLFKASKVETLTINPDFAHHHHHHHKSWVQCRLTSNDCFTIFS